MGSRGKMTAAASTSSKQKKAEKFYQASQDKLCTDDYDGAVKDLQKACQLDPEYEEYASAYGGLLADIGQAEEAIKALQHSVERFPEKGFQKYMYLGQLLSGQQGIESLQKGLQLLQAETEREENLELKKQLQSQFASGLCSLVELRMEASDESQLDQLAAECEPLLMQACQADAKSPEPKQVLASLRYEQGRAEEALQSLKESMSLWFRQDEDSASEHSNTEEEGAKQGERQNGSSKPMDLDDNVVEPSYEFRFETAKLLIELDETTEDACQILEDLMAENDQDIHVVYLLALAYHAGGQSDTALEVLGDGEKLLEANKHHQDIDMIATGFATLKADVQEILKLSEAMEHLQK